MDRALGCDGVWQTEVKKKSSVSFLGNKYQSTEPKKLMPREVMSG